VVRIQQFNRNDIDMVRTERLYQGFFKMNRYVFRHKLFAGGWSGEVSREIFERGHAVAMLPYDPHLEEFVILEQLRIGAAATNPTPWLLEIVAGIIDEGESPESVCYREAEEEAGLQVQKLFKALSYLASPGGTTERLHVYIGMVDASQAEGIYGLEYENEDILVHRVKEQTAYEWIATGKIDNAATLIALQWFALNKQTLLDEWLGDTP
jgi:ADP-ribose pyrophosphatase